MCWIKNASSSAKVPNAFTTGGRPWVNGHIALLGVGSAVEDLIDLRPSRIPTANRRISSVVRVVDLELLSAALNVDAALPEGNAMTVDALVGVAHNEQIVR